MQWQLISCQLHYHGNISVTQALTSHFVGSGGGGGGLWRVHDVGCGEDPHDVVVPLRCRANLETGACR